MSAGRGPARRTARRTGPFGRLAVVGAAIAVLVAAINGPSLPRASAQETTTSVSAAPALPAGVSLVSQDTWVGLRHTFTMKLHIDNPTLAARPGAAIATTVYPSATSRSGFDQIVQNQDLGSSLYVPSKISVASLRPDARGDVSVTFGLANSDVTPTINITRHGVYPVKVELVNTGVAAASFVTWLVAVDTTAPINKQLSVAFVLQAVSNPVSLPNHADDPKVVAEMKPGGRLDKIATVLSHTGGVRFSLVVGPETAQTWRRLATENHALAAGFAALRAAALSPSTEMLPTTYVPIDAAELEGAGLGSYLAGQYTAGASALNAAFRATPSTPAQSAFIDPAPTSDAVVDGLHETLIDRVAVRSEALIPVQHQFTPAQPFVLDTAGGEARAVATAPFVETLFNGPDPSALRAERVIAALAEIAYETPSISRGIVLAPPARWNPDVDTMETVIAALRTLPLVQSATLDDLFSTIVNEQVLGTDVQRRLVAAVPAPTPVDPEQYRDTQIELAAYRDVVGPQDPVVVEGNAALLTALSTSISPTRANLELARIDTAVRSFTSGVQADAKRITLTSRRADVPLSFENHLKPARTVRVRVHLDSAKLNFPKGADQIIPLRPGSNTVVFTVEARASGTFPMKITVTSPNGGLTFGAPVLVSVRSAVFGGWAVGVTVVALLFLAGWWANHFRRTRRNRRLATRAPGSGGTTPAPAT